MSFSFFVLTFPTLTYKTTTATLTFDGPLGVPPLRFLTSTTPLYHLTALDFQTRQQYPGRRSFKEVTQEKTRGIQEHDLGFEK